MREINYSTRPITMHELELAQLAAKDGNITAFLEYVVLRTDLTRAEVEVMDIEGATIVMDKIVEGLKTAEALAKLSKAMQ